MTMPHPIQEEEKKKKTTLEKLIEIFDKEDMDSAMECYLKIGEFLHNKIHHKNVRLTAHLQKLPKRD